MRSGWTWAQEPGKAIDFERTETGFEADLRQVRSFSRSLLVWRRDPMSSVMALPGALLGGAGALALIVGLGHADLFIAAVIPMAIGAQISSAILYPVVLDGRLVVDRDRVELRHGNRVVWKTTLDRLAVDVDYDTLVLIGANSTLRMRCRERTEDLEFLAEKLREASVQHGTALDVPVDLVRVQRKTTER